MEMTTTFWVILFVLLMLFQLIGLIIMKLNCSFILKLYAFFWPNKRNLQNKTVWLIGGSSGIGKELALQLAKLNCRLALTSTNQTKLDEVRQLCLGRTKIQPEEILALACDIRVQDQCDATFGRIVAEFGDIDVLICNAGRFTAGLITDDDYYRELKSMFKINFFPHVYITRLVLSHWLSIKKRDGLARLDRRILYTSSTFSIIESPFCSAYCASKRSLNIFAHDLAFQHQAKDGISVCIVHPGQLPTESSLIANSHQKRELNSDSVPKMKTRHIAHLALVALANRVHESYLCHQPMLFITYLYDNFWWYLLFLFRSFDLVDTVKQRFFNEPEISAL